MIWEQENTRERKPIRVDFKLDRDLDSGIQAFGDELFQERYMLSIKVFTEFWSNKAQLPYKKQDAIKAAQTYLFRNMIPLLHSIRRETDSPEIYRMAGEVLDEMTKADFLYD